MEVGQSRLALNSTKARVTLLFLGMLSIVIVSISFAYFKTTKNIEVQSKQHLSGAATVLQSSISSIILNSKTILHLFAQTKNTLYSAKCNERLATLGAEDSLQKLFSGYVLLNSQGKAVCHSYNHDISTNNLETLEMFESILNSDSFSVGVFKLDHMSGRFIIPVGLPVEDKSGRKFVLVGAVSPQVFQNTLDSMPLINSSGLFLISHEGRVIAAKHNLGNGHWFNKDISKTKLFKKIIQAESGSGKANGLDNLIRYYSYQSFKVGAQQFHLLATAKESEVLGSLLGDFTDPLGISVLIIIFSSIFLLLTIYLFFIRNIKQLATATDSIIKGISRENESISQSPDRQSLLQMSEVTRVASNMRLIQSKLEQRTRDLVQVRNIAKICSWKYLTKEESFLFSNGYENVIPIANLNSLYVDDFLNCLPENDSAELVASLKKLCNEKQPFKQVIRFYPYQSMSPDNLRYIEIQGAQSLNSLDTSVSYIGTIQDVTQAVKWQKALEDSQKFLSTVLDNLSESVIACDKNGKLKVFNKTTEELHGLSVKDVPLDELSSYYSLYTEDGSRKLTTDEIPLLRALSGESFTNVRFRVAPKNTPYRIVEVQGHPIKDRNNKRIGAVVIQEDITALLASKSQLKQSEDEFKLIFDSSSDALFVVDTSRQIIKANKMAERVFGYNQEELMALRFDALFQQDDWPILQAARQRIEEATLTQVELHAIHSEKHLFTVELSISAVKLHGKNTFLKIVRDVTERKLVEERMSNLQRMEVVGKITGGVVHDFNNLLQVILMNLDLLEEDLENNPDLKRLVLSAQKASLKGGELVKHLQAFTHQQPLKVTNVDLNEQLTKSMKLLESVFRHKADIKVEIIDRPLPIDLDVPQFEIMLTHLLMNALEASKEDCKVSIRVNYINLASPMHLDGEILEPGEYAQLFVKDNGPGMSESVRKRAVEPFYTTKQLGQVAGLGLSMVFGFANRSGGGLEINSKLNEGTEIIVYFPILKN